MLDIQDSVVADESGLLDLDLAGAVGLGLDSDLGGEPHTGVLVVDFRDAGEHLGGVPESRQGSIDQLIFSVYTYLIL